VGVAGKLYVMNHWKVQGILRKILKKPAKADMLKLTVSKEVENGKKAAAK